jgi:putative DNA primase/helicase
VNEQIAGTLAALQEVNRVLHQTDEKGRVIDVADSVPSAEVEFTLDDIGNARRFVAEHAGEFRFVSTLHPPWLIWDGRRWTGDTRQLHLEAAKATADQMLRDATTPDERKAAREARRLQRLRAMLELAQSDPAIARQANEFDSDPWLLNVGNGTVDLRTGDLRPHDRGDLITLLAGADYDPDAPTPVWNQFLERVLPSLELRAYTQRLHGLAAVGLTLEHVLPVLHGSGANGKTTFVNAVKTAFGEYAHEAPVATLIGSARPGNATPDLADLRGRRLVTVSETREDGRLSVERVKVLTGGDEITARYLYRRPFTFKPSHVVVLQTNHRPRIRDDGHAIWRRLKLVPFGETIPEGEQRKELAQELAAERDGILAWWIVAGAVDYMKQGLAEPEVITRATAEYRREEDQLIGWIEECCDSDAGAWVSTSELRESYASWAKANGFEPISSTALAARLRARTDLDLVPERHANGTRGWRGLRLRSPRGEAAG